MIYFIFNIIYLAIFIFAIYWTYGMLQYAGNGIANYLKIKLSGHLLPLSVVALMILWVYASYSTFKDMCTQATQPVFFSHPATTQKGYAVEYSNPLVFTTSSFNTRIALETYNFKFVEENGRRSCKAEVQGKNSFSCVGLENERANYVLKIPPWKRIDKWWSPHIYKAVYIVEEIDSKKLLASAGELIFGGGVTSIAMRMLGGDQDYSFIGCGYISKEIGLVRPTLMSKREMRHHEYIRADLEFLTRALFPFKED